MKIKNLQFDVFVPATPYTTDTHFPIDESIFVNNQEFYSSYPPVRVELPAIKRGDHIRAVTACNQFKCVVLSASFDAGEKMGRGPGYFCRVERGEYSGAFAGFGQHWSVFRPFLDLEKIKKHPVESSTGAKTVGELAALHDDGENGYRNFTAGNSNIVKKLLSALRA